jgi:protein TonB
MMWLVLAAQLSLPVPSDPGIPDVRAVFSADDFPSYLAAAGVSRMVHTRTTVRPDGTTQGCVAEESSGDPKLDAYTCAIIVRRARFRPATWTDGTPAYGVMRVPVRWAVSNQPSSSNEPSGRTAADVELSVDRLPKGAHKTANVSLQVATDESGHPVTCVEVPPLGKPDPKRHFPQLVPLACKQVMASLILTPPIDAAGKPVRSVQRVSVEFRRDR